MATRLFDILASLAGLALTLPTYPFIALLIKLDSPGTVFFCSERMGLNGRTFRMLKFRSMVSNGATQRSITIKHDPRITKVGRWLRSTKFDEIPTLLNVFKGDMSIVGPRPEVTRYASYYSGDNKRVLSVRPGITDPGTLQFNDESKLLQVPETSEEVYVQRILPEKLRLNLEYIDSRSFLSDLRIIFATFWLMLPRMRR